MSIETTPKREASLKRSGVIIRQDDKSDGEKIWKKRDKEMNVEMIIEFYILLTVHHVVILGK